MGWVIDKFREVDGTRLGSLRKESALSQQDLGRESSIVQPTISALEGTKREVRPSTIRKLAEALGVELREK